MNREQPEPLETNAFDRLPGWELVRAGLADLATGRTSVEASLVASASTRLTRLGIAVPPGSESVAEDLYERVSREVGETRAHARYNALRRRLASFLHSAADARPH